MDLGKVKDFLRESEQRIGKYEVVREIARGGMSVVLEAFDPDLERRVAVKLLRAGDIERLRQEASAAARLRHPHIIGVHEVGPDHIVMDFVAGGTFADAMPSLSTEERAAVIATVARAIHHAHSEGVIHRDLKPSNVLMDADGRPVVTDFGLAKIFAGGSGGDPLTAEGSLLGTPPYMAPEQVRGKDVGPAADVWALGVMLHEALAGRRPFDGPTAPDIYDQIVRRDPPPLAGPLGAVARRALEKDPARRHPSAADLADDIERALRGEAVPWMARLARRRAAVAIIGAMVAAAGALASWRALRGQARPWDPGREQAQGQGQARGQAQGQEAAPATAPRPAPFEDREAAWRAREDELNRAVQAEPDEVEPRIARADLRRVRADRSLERGRNPLPDYGAAAEDLDHALRIDPASSAARFARGYVIMQRGIYKMNQGIDPLSDLAAAETDLGAALAHPGARTWRGNVRLQRGVWLRGKGEVRRAAAEFAAAEADLSPAEDSNTLMRRGRLRASLGRFAEAESDFAECVRREPGHALCWAGRASARLRAGDFAAAEAHFTHALAANPTYAVAWEGRGDARAKLGRFGGLAGAVADWNQAIAIDPTHAHRLRQRILEAESATAAQGAR